MRNLERLGAKIPITIPVYFQHRTEPKFQELRTLQTFHGLFLLSFQTLQGFSLSACSLYVYISHTHTRLHQVCLAINIFFSKSCAVFVFLCDVMGNLHLKIDFVTEAHIFNNVSRQKALVNLIFALKSATYREGLIKNGRRLLIFLVKCCLCLVQNMQNMLFNLVNIFKRYRYIVVANQFLIKISEILFFPYLSEVVFQLA